MNRLTGFSIIEFMIAITLGALLVAVVSTVYLSNKNTFRAQASLSRLQENARFANYFLNHEIRMAGFQGCLNETLLTVTNLVKNPQIMAIYDNPVYGYDGLDASFSPSLPSNLIAKTESNSDVVEIRMASNSSVQMRSDMNRSNNPILVYDRIEIQAGDTLMINDCRVADIFIAGANGNASAITHTVTNNISNNLSKAYATGAHIMHFIYYAFYIKNTGRSNSVNQPIYALMRQDLHGNESEIVEGVERMRILYGVDTNSDKAADTYQTATQVTNNNNWKNVISIKINLLLLTNENVYSKPQSYQFNGTSYTPTDRRMRHEWQTFINLRNRGLPS